MPARRGVEIRNTRILSHSENAPRLAGFDHGVGQAHVESGRNAVRARF